MKIHTTRLSRAADPDWPHPEFPGALAGYSRTLSLVVESKINVTEPDVLNVLLSRNRVHNSLRKEPNPSRDRIETLVALDSQLKSHASSIVNKIGEKPLRNWRQSIQPNESEWWWYLDSYAESARPKLHPAVSYPAWLVVAIALAYLVEMLRRMLGDSTEILLVVTQGMLGLVVTGAILKTARQIIGTQSPNSRATWKAAGERYAFAISIVLLAALTYFGTDRLATYYNNRGIQKQNSGLISSAKNDYKRAIRIAPGFEMAHYNLAYLNEETGQFDRAVEEYQLALESDFGSSRGSEYYRALTYSNLAHLYLAHRNDPKSAHTLLDGIMAPGGYRISIEAPEPEKLDLESVLHRNYGWAKYGLALSDDKADKKMAVVEASGNQIILAEAIDELKAAIRLNPDRPNAHYLLARALERQEKAAANAGAASRSGILNEYLDFLASADNGTEQVDPKWRALAQQRIPEIRNGVRH